MDGAMVPSVRSSPVRVRDLLIAAVPQLEEHLLQDAIRRDWSQTVGPELGRRSRPARLRAGVLDVTVDNSPWLHEMTLRSPQLLAAVRARFSNVGALKFTHGAIAPPVEKQPRRERREAPGRLSREERSIVDAAVSPVSDAALAASLRRLLTKDLLARRMPDPSPRSGIRDAGREGA